MGRAALARLAIGIAGTLVTGLLATTSGLGPVWIVLVVVAGFVVTGLLAEAAFRALASAEEIRQDLEERLRSSD